MGKIFTNKILGINIAVSCEKEAGSYILDNMDELSGQYICLVSINDLLEAQHNPVLREFFRQSAINFPSSEPIAYVQRLRGFRVAESVRLKNLSGDIIWAEEGEHSLSSIKETAEKENKLVIYTGKKAGLSEVVRFGMACIPDSFKRQVKDPEDKKDLLIYAHYYYPDVASTGQILTELAEGLGDTFHTTVICTVPSYTGKIDKHYKQHLYYYENIGGVDVLRIRVPEFRKNFSISRIVNILAYFVYAIAATQRVGHQDYVYTISQPPVLGGLLGYIGKIMKRAKFIYNIQDFNPEQIMAVSYSKNPLVLKTMMALDKFSCKKSDKIIIVGRDMIDTLRARFPKELPCYAHINNWINEKEIYPLPADNEKVTAFKKKYGIDGKFVIMYSGNIGLYYDLLEIQKIIEKFNDNKDVVFAFIGQGTVLEDMQKYSAEHHMTNIVYIPYQDKADLVYSLNAGDVHFVVNAKGIKGVSVPSKLYGVMAAGKPVLGILEEGSEARLIVEEAGCGKVVEPGNYEAITDIIRYFIDHKSDPELRKMGADGRTFLENNLTKSISISKYAQEILKL
ncbi:glycosyltransferase family 4 protein [Butyrivibrio sp. MC2021]|uniref:glycosyltransferase family 4 protein n=1 Tax=Butyrivibrio sp. MC2021 TaxID=1408306 RepID=UPI000A5657BD|nr:glycosyltransferase family 4 protein [Butyrivibrio sp. MC2021]